MCDPRGRRRTALCALLAVSLVLNSTGLYWGMPNTNAWHGDDMCHLTLRALADGFREFTTRPLVHHLTLSALYAPYLGWLFLRGEIDPHAASIESAFANPIASMTILIVLGRVVNVAMTTATVWLLFRIVERFTGSWVSGLVAGAVYAFSVTTVLYSEILGVDAPMMFWFALTFGAYLRFADSFSPRTGVWLGVLISLSVSTKEQIGGCYVLLVAALLAIYLRRRRDPAQHSQSARGLLVMLISILVTYSVLSRLVFDPEGWLRRMRWWVGEGTDAAIWGGFDDTLAGHVGLLRETGEKLASSMGLPLLALSSAAAIFALARGGGRAWLVALPLISYYVFMIAIIRYTATRFMLPVIFLLAALTGLAVAEPLLRRRVPWTAALVCIVAALAWSVDRCRRANQLMSTDTRYRAEAYLSTALPAHAHVEVYDDDHYLPRIERLGLVRDFARDRMQMEEFLTRRPDAVVLSPGCWWKLTQEQRRFLAWLRTRSGYSEHVIDPDPRSALLAIEDAQLVQPVILVLTRGG